MQEINDAPVSNHRPKAKALIFNGCAKFFIRWIKRDLDLAESFLSFPLNIEEPQSLTPTILNSKEFRKMPMAYVLLNTEIGAENQVLAALKKIEGVEEAHNLLGVYDIIANIKADSLEKLRYVITKGIGQIATDKLEVDYGDN